MGKYVEKGGTGKVKSRAVKGGGGRKCSKSPPSGLGPTTEINNRYDHISGPKTRKNFGQIAKKQEERKNALDASVFEKSERKGVNISHLRKGEPE